ncbi:MAG: peptidase M14 [Candidatus Hydrogenedentes bacterium]|nr:peptidase M14 [Candidatus Hydrogenedentota bacterium]
MPSLIHPTGIVISPEDIAFRDAVAVGECLDAQPGLCVSLIGESRKGQPLFGYVAGSGPLLVSITAGCHADEPVGPMTAQALPRLLRTHAPHLLEAFTFRVAPQMNPDGADLNRAWFSTCPDFQTYLAHTVRELPGDDVEFGFSEDAEARPECRAAIPFLWRHGPVVAHFSLHGMAWAEGMWFLINAPWATRCQALMDSLTRLCRDGGLPLMELERNGEKGFSRIGQGFSTTPTSTAMKEHFLGLGDTDMAARFLPSSMEMAMKTGDDPLCMVSELPLFLLDVPPALDDPVLYRFRDALNVARAVGTPEALVKLAADFKLRTLSLGSQVALQFAMIVHALDYVIEARAPRSR